MSQAEIGHITTNPSVCGGKPCVAGSRIRVQDVYVWHEMQGLSADEIVSRFPQLTMADVYAALSYYWDHRDEIQRQMAADQQLVESMKRQFGSPLRYLPNQFERADDLTDHPCLLMAINDTAVLFTTLLKS